MLDSDVCVGNQELIGKKRAIADAGRARERLDRVAQGDALVLKDAAGDAVKTLQRGLVILGYSTSFDGSALVDGDYDKGTERGVRQFQLESGLPTTGLLDGATLVALDHAVAAGLAAVDDEDRTCLRDILDRTLDMTPGELKARHRPAIQSAAQTAGVREEVIAAITIVESGGGGNNRPKFEPHHLTALEDLRAAVDGTNAAGIDAQGLAALMSTIRAMPLRAGENGLKSSVGRTLLDAIAGGGSAALRVAIAKVQRWTPRDIRELATSWGWGQIMGWHTVEKRFSDASISLASLRSLKPEVQITTLGQAISVEPRWSDAARLTNDTDDFSHFAAAYNGAKIGSDGNKTYADRMAKAAAEYEQS
jgi:hypothetical protein